MNYRRYSNQNRVIDRDKIYLSDYIEQLKSDADTMIGSVGNSVKILKNYKLVSHIIDHVGDITPRGRHGGRRQLQPVKIENPEKIDASGGEVVYRPLFDNEIIVPALIDLTPSDETRAMYGFNDSESGLITISRKFLDSRNIVVDQSKDYFGVQGAVYKIRLSDDNDRYLDNGHTYTFTIKKDF
jgi:hypothetical protein